MDRENTVVDPEIEKIKLQLTALGIMIVAACLILPFGLPAWFNAPVIIGSPVFVAYGYIKFKKYKQQKTAVQS